MTYLSWCSITDRPKGDHKDKQRRNIQSDEIWEIFFRLGSNVLPRGVGSKLKWKVQTESFGRWKKEINASVKII